MAAGDWADRLGTSVHVDGHRVGLMSGPGEPQEWWFYHRDYRRVALQTVGPEPRGPYQSMRAAKAALSEFQEPQAERHAC